MIPYEEIKLLTSIKGEESQAGEAGASGKVVMGLWKGKVVAVKLMNFQNVENFEPGWRKGIQELNESKKKEIEKEAENYSKLSHPNIIKFYGLTRVGNCVHIVIEYVEGGSLQELIGRTLKKTELLDAVKKIQIALDVAVGVNYLHVDREMVHRDLKPQNILICEGYRAKLCDFGSARNVTNITLQNVGTTLYAAPEVFTQEGRRMGSYAADVYSFGVILWCLFFETKPPGMRETMPPKTIPKVACEKKTAKAVVAVVKECCGVKPERRTRMKEVVVKLEKMLVELKTRNYQRVVNEVDRLKSELAKRVQREAAMKSEVAQKEAVLNSRIAELQKGLNARDNEVRKLEKSLKQVQKEAVTKEVEIKRLKSELERSTKEMKVSKAPIVTKTPKPKESVNVKEKQREMEMQSSSSDAVQVHKGFKSHRGILVPQNVVFEVSGRYRSDLKRVFSNGNKVAKGIGGFKTACFKTSTVFTAGKKFYFQVSANVGYGGYMGFGILSGEVTTEFVGFHSKGWDYNCYPGTKLTVHNSQQSRGYGPKRTTGKHKFGIFCDFTNGKGEVSFIVDGKNCGVAYKNVKPPVSPAFYIMTKEDSFKIEDTFEVPDCL